MGTVKEHGRTAPSRATTVDDLEYAASAEPSPAARSGTELRINGI